MVKETKFEKDIFGNIVNSKNIQYFGKDALNADVSENIKEHIKNDLFQECILFNGDKGLIVGFEDNIQFYDYYYIVLNYKTKSIDYELINACRVVREA